MIRKLRAKFVTITMSLITLILAAVLAGICLFFAQNIKRQSGQALEVALSRPQMQTPPNFRVGGPPAEDFHRAPIFTIAIASNGQTDLLMSDRVEVSEEDLASIAQAIIESPAQQGRLPDYNLRYLAKDTEDGKMVALIDLTDENRMMGNIVLVCCLVGVVALAAFFAVSVLLARWTLKPVEQAWAMQRRFVSDASHELKTPLTVIMANTEILKAHPQDSVASQMTWVENTEQEADRMKGLVDSMLFLAKHDDVGHQPLMARVNLSDVTSQSMLLFESIAFEQDISITETVESGIGILGDERQLKQLVFILLDNAIKYSEPQGIVALKLEKHHGFARLSVCNQGKPIPDEDKRHLFERFYRADFSRAKDGYGLGLSIAKTIVDVHKGKISVDSSCENGTVFKVAFPLH